MGIRFFCPKGHSLNVKSELAGKIGYCPKCNTRMIIPTESTRLPGEHFCKDNQSLAKAYTYDSGDTSGEHGGSAGIPVNVAALNNESVNKNEQENTNIHSRTEQLNSSEYKSDTENDSAIIQSLANSPLFGNTQLLWYVRTPKGEQFGPASGEIFLQWIKERRIGPLTYIWRQDWENWQEAGKAIPQIKAFFESSDVAVSSSLVDESSRRGQYRGANDRDSSLADKLVQRQRKASMSFKIICGLIGVCFVLLGLLIFLLLR